MTKESTAWWEKTFQELSQHKVNLVRIFVHCKGERNPLMDNIKNQNVIGLNPDFTEDLNKLLDIAAKYQLYTILVLWDF